METVRVKLAAAIELETVEWTERSAVGENGSPATVEYRRVVGIASVERIVYLADFRLVAISGGGRPALLVPIERVNSMRELEAIA